MSEEMKPMRMFAYYYGFEPTGVQEIDLILCAVASAGKGFHRTEDWGDKIEVKNYDERLEGKTFIEAIQNAANAAAKKFAK